MTRLTVQGVLLIVLGLLMLAATALQVSAATADYPMLVDLGPKPQGGFR